MNDIKNQIDIILVETSHPGNIGSVARAMKTMGLKNLILVNPKEFPSKEAFMLSGNAQDVIEEAIVVDTLEELLKTVLIFMLPQPGLEPSLGQSLLQMRPV